jgi:hypothetical protein
MRPSRITIALLLVIGVGAVARNYPQAWRWTVVHPAALASSHRNAGLTFDVLDAVRPRSLQVRISAQPGRWITAVWTVTCHRGFALRTINGSASDVSPLLRDLALPILRPERCTAIAGGQLEVAGAISVELSTRMTKQ